MADFQIDFLDHVAIRVTDLETSAQWYEKVLGLQRYSPEAWQPFPIFLLAGKTGIALFPANPSDVTLDAQSKNVKIDHFACINPGCGGFKHHIVRFDVAMDNVVFMQNLDAGREDPQQ